MPSKTDTTDTRPAAQPMDRDLPTLGPSAMAMLRKLAAGAPRWVDLPNTELARLLRDRDHYRGRAGTEAQDVEDAQVTSSKAQAWIRAQVPAELFETSWAEWSEHWLGMSEISSAAIAELCIEAHEEWGFPASMMVLDEMAKGST